MSDAGYIAVRTLPRISPEQTRDARARAWAFVFQCWQEKQMAAEPAPEPDGRDDHERLAKKKGGQRDLREDAFLGAEGDRTEQIRKDKHGFVHR